MVCFYSWAYKLPFQFFFNNFLFWSALARYQLGHVWHTLLHIICYAKKNKKDPSIYPSMECISSPMAAVVKYCNQHVCVSVCLSVCEHISRTTCTIFSNFFAHVAYGDGLVLLRWGDATRRGKGSFGGLFPIDNALYGPYSGMNFPKKDWFGFN